MLDDPQDPIAQSRCLVAVARELCATPREARQRARVAVARADDLVERCRATDHANHRRDDRIPALIGEET